MTFALNHLSYFLLTHLLLDTILASAPARIVNVASSGHRNAQIDFDDLQSEVGYRGMQAYGKSKLANVLHAYELSRRLAGTGVTVNALHPGLVATNLAKNNGWLIRVFMPLMRLVARSPEEGARNSIYLASSPDVDGVTGKYFVDDEAVPSSAVSYDEEIARKLWQVSLEMTGLRE